MPTYNAVTTKAGRYVQGGGCATVGVVGLIQSGGFGSFSKNYGLAAASLLQAEIVTADGQVLIANACSNPDLFWALKGGGGGSFGVVTKVTLATYELPAFFGRVQGLIKANSDVAFRKLIGEFMRFYHETLFNRHWGESVSFGADNALQFNMAFQGLDQAQAKAAWQTYQIPPVMEAATLIAFTLFQRSRPPCASTARFSNSFILIAPFSFRLRDGCERLRATIFAFRLITLDACRAVVPVS